MPEPIDASTCFKRCTMCGAQWWTRDVFLEDGGVSLVGYQVNYGDLEAGDFLFNHTCGTTLAIPAGSFMDLYDGPVFAERVRGTDACPDYCLYPDDLRRCPVQCECAYVRDVLQIVRNWPKK